MLYDNVLVPYDGSASADAALAEAVRFAKEDPGLALHVVSVVDIEHIVIEKLQGGSSQAAVPEGMRQAFEEAEREAEEHLSRKVRLATRGLMNAVHTEVLNETNIGVQIVAYAAGRNIDLVIMGSRGLGGLRGILGSVSSFVLKEAQVPVLVVKE